MVQMSLTRSWQPVSPATRTACAKLSSTRTAQESTIGTDFPNSTDIINRCKIANYWVAKELMFRNVVAKALTCHDMDDLSDEVVAPARQMGSS